MFEHKCRAANGEFSLSPVAVVIANTLWILDVMVETEGIFTFTSVVFRRSLDSRYGWELGGYLTTECVTALKSLGGYRTNSVDPGLEKAFLHYIRRMSEGKGSESRLHHGCGGCL